jgi:hypothetical protein
VGLQGQNCLVLTDEHIKVWGQQDCASVSCPRRLLTRFHDALPLQTNDKAMSKRKVRIDRTRLQWTPVDWSRRGYW